jgi:PAS domain S-box-containing protein
MSLFSWVSDPVDLLPHGFCLEWRPELIWLHVISDSVIGLAYYSIPVALIYFIAKRRDVAFSWIFWQFAAFILACGTTHWFGVWTLWHPDYITDGLIKLATAMLSIGTALALWQLMPHALALPSPAQLQQANEKLSSEIRERTLVLDALRREKEFSEMLIASGSDGILAFDRQLRYTLWNPAMERLTGVKAESVIGRASYEVFPFLKNSAVWEVIQGALEGRIGTVVDEPYVVPETGRNGFFEARYSPLYGKRGDEVVGGIGFVRDTTERRRIEERARQQQRLEAVGHLTGGVAHDFNNLLTVVSSALELLEKRTDGSEHAACLTERAQRASANAERLTHQLLAFARRQTHQLKSLVLNDIVDDCKTLVQRAAGEQIRVEFRLDPALGTCRVDSSECQAAILNLVMNACDAMLPSGGSLTLETANAEPAAETAQRLEIPPGRYATLTVQDTGVGMSPEVQAKAVEPFYTTKGVGKGSGLGLSQVHGFIKQSGGALDIESAPGCGTRVTIWLPLTAAAGGAVVPEESSAA